MRNTSGETSQELLFRQLLTPNEVVTLGLTAGPEVGWDAGLESLQPPKADYYRLWDMKVAWRDVNPSPGVFDWSILDRRVAQVESWGAKPILVLGLTPEWAAADKTAGQEPWGPGSASPPADMNAWREYVRAVVARYGSRIGAYEIWNEMNLKTFWTGTLEQMADIVRIATEEIGDSALALAPSVTTRLPSGSRTTRDFVPLLTPETLSAIDAWTIHSYPDGDAGPGFTDACAERVDDIVEWQRGLVASAIRLDPDGLPTINEAIVQKQVWDTEVNFGLKGPGDVPKTAWSDSDGALLLHCAYIDSQALGIDVTVWYEFTATDYDLLGVQMTPDTPKILQAWSDLPSSIGGRTPWVPSFEMIVGRVLEIQRLTRASKDSLIIVGASTGLPEGRLAWVRFVIKGRGASVATAIIGKDGRIRQEIDFPEDERPTDAFLSRDFPSPTESNRVKVPEK